MQNFIKMNLNTTHILILGFMVFGVVNGQIPMLGPCPDIPAFRNFNKTAFSGFWYEAAKFCFIPELLGSCVTAQYILNPDGTLNTQLALTDILTNKRKVIPGITYFVDDTPTGNAQLVVDLVNIAVPFPTPQYSYLYKVIDTDYTGYVIKWSCVSTKTPTLDTINFQSMWVLARNATTYPGSATQATVNNFLTTNGLPTPKLIPAKQTCSTV